MAFDSFNPTENLIPNEGNLVFDATTGEGGRSPAETILPYIEQRGAEPGDGPKGETVRVIAIIAPPEHDDAGIEWTYCPTGQPSADGSTQGIIIDWRATGPGDELTADFSATGQANEDGHSFPTETIKMTYGAIEWTNTKDTGGGDGRTSGPVDDLIGWDFRPGDSQAANGPVATESLEIAHEGFLDGRGGGRDDGWCALVEIDLSESVHALYDLVL